MNILYIECAMGAAGDMLAAALLELHPNPDDFVRRMNALGLPGVAFSAHPAEKCGLRGTHVHVVVHGEEEHSHDCDSAGHAPHAHHHAHEHTHEHEHHAHTHSTHAHTHHHASLVHLKDIVQALPIPEQVKDKVWQVYTLIAQAEAKAHGVPVEQVHFHEVGALDAVADITAVCWLLHELSPDTIVASPVHVGSGQVRCAHGVLPVPAPATAALLCGVPIYGGAVQGELCTPTGAALLRAWVSSFGKMPCMTVEKIGCGMGSKDFPQANCVRAFWGQIEQAEDEVAQLDCNLDDMPPEDIAFAQELLFEAGALDVYTTAAQMKKGRPGVVLTCLCRVDDAPAMAALLLRHTTTLGVRESRCRRYTLHRTVQTVQTPYGAVRRKTAQGTGAASDVKKQKWEYEDVARIARAEHCTLAHVRDVLNQQTEE